MNLLAEVWIIVPIFITLVAWFAMGLEEGENDNES